jgi:hypothetical protein
MGMAAPLSLIALMERHRLNDDEIKSRIAANARPWGGYWAWRDKPVGERGAASKILRQAGIQVAGLVSRRDDPPDCEGMLDRQWSAVELTELVHQTTLERSLKAIKERAAGRQPENFVWNRTDLLRAIQERIEVKDAIRLKGGPYERYALVIYTDEFFLDSATVRRFLKGATFRAHLITDVILGLSYEPASGDCPVFPLELTRR